MSSTTNKENKTRRVSVRIPVSIKKEIESYTDNPDTDIPNKSEFIREAIKEKLDRK
jgi:Arc/MetJ-type ribon-helix-helix transcriptional regulator